MFASFLQSKKRQPSETTPLLAALNRYRSRQNGEADEEDDAEAIGQDDGEEEYEDEDRQRDGPLLPVFSSTFLGMLALMRHCLPSLTILQTAYPSTTPPTRSV